MSTRWRRCAGPSRGKVSSAADPTVDEDERADGIARLGAGSLPSTALDEGPEVTALRAALGAALRSDADLARKLTVD